MVGERGRVVAAFAVGALLLGACGGGDDDSGGADDSEPSGEEATATTVGEAPAEVTAASVQAIADTTAGVDSYAFDMSVTLTGMSAVPGAPAGMPDEAAVTVSGGADLAGGRTQIELDISEILGVMATALGGEADTSGAVIETVIDGEDVYLDFGAMGVPYGVEEGQWVHMTLEELNTWLGGGAGGSSLSPTDPASFTALFRGVDADTDIAVQGEEEVNGAATTHVIATADIAQAVAAAPEEQRAAIEAQFATLGVPEVPVHLWLAGDGLPRRIQVIAENGQVASLAGVGVSVVVEPYDYGQPVEAEAPAADSVVEASSLSATPTTAPS